MGARWLPDDRTDRWLRILGSEVRAAEPPTRGRTHSCAGCSERDPCPSCGGNIDLKSPAIQALDWGLRVASASPGVSRWWAANRVAQTVREAPLPDTPETRAVRSFVSGALLAFPRGSQGMSTPVAPWRGSQALSIFDLADGPSNGGAGPGGVGARGRVGAKKKKKKAGVQPRCCVVKFCYPEKIHVVVTPDMFAPKVQVIFTVFAQYLNAALRNDIITYATGGGEDGGISRHAGGGDLVGGGDGDGGDGGGDPEDRDAGVTRCWCPCCRFEQMVRMELTGTTADAADHNWHEDCSCFHDDSGRITNPPAFRGLPPNSHAGQPCPEGQREVCYGRGSRPGPPDSEWPPGLETDADCIYRMTDHPEVELQRDADFRVLFEFIGRIRDKCRNDVIVREKRFSILLVGNTREVAANRDRVPRFTTSTITQDGQSQNLPTDEQVIDKECK